MKIIYTSDVHGQLNGYNYANRRPENIGLSRLSTYLKTLTEPYVLIDNGDMLQGNILTDFHRENNSSDTILPALIMNELGYHYFTLGNHDFNYGIDFLMTYIKQSHAKVLCCNVYDDLGNHLFPPFHIHTIDHLKIGIIGAVTHYVPHWEKPQHIKGICFEDAYLSIKKYVKHLRPKVDLLIVSYHGGFEKDLVTLKNVGRITYENQGYAISQIEGIDVLLTGHQHVPINHVFDSKLIALQTSLNAADFGEIQLSFSQTHQKQFAMSSQIVKMDFAEDQKITSLLEKVHQKAEKHLDISIGSTQQDMSISDPLTLRSKKHPLIQLMNDLQMAMSHADISATSLPNNPIGFKKTITLRDLAANFIYPNTFVKLKITGAILKKAIERSATYYKVENGKLCIDESFLVPKIEHYNVDIYDGISYVIDARKPKGKRLVSLHYKGNPVKDDQTFSIILNNYRAIGGGDYDMYVHAEVLQNYDYTLYDLFKAYILKHVNIHVDIKHNFKIINS